MSESRRQASDDGSPAIIASRRLPTRVSNACNRCRRNKSRCDAFRPCSLCVRANVDCEQASLDEHPKGRPQIRSERRASKLRKRPQATNKHNIRSATSLPAQQALSLQEDCVAGTIENDYVAESIAQHGSWPSLDYGESESAMGIARKIYRLGSQTIDENQTSAIPDGGAGTRTPLPRNGCQRLPISTILEGRFPDLSTIHLLLEEYFEAVHWFSLVVYEPKFRRQLQSIEDGYAQPSEAPFLTLLSTVLGMAAWYQSKKRLHDISQDWRLWSDDLLKIVEMRLVQVMDQRSLAAVQTLILLGSHHVYHGRPNLSFALLGATIKMSHALGLHRGQNEGSFDDIEERKRAWWTIYTWDRFASISYGRPLSINDEDYNVDLPAKFSESPFFGSEATQAQVTGVCYSPYQTELTQLYLIASPALKKIFGSLSARATCQYFDSEHRSLITNVIQRLSSWRRRLPTELCLDLKRDYDPSTTGWSVRAHLLQSLSLQLTFDNLLIVLHRPFLARQLENLSLSSPGPNGSSVAEMISPSASHGGPQSLASQGSVHSPHENQDLGIDPTAISEQWWDAAVRTASVTELPQLTQLATESHLVAFVAMNMFNAAIVLILVALSDPLSDQAQGIKRPITKVFRLEELLGQRSSLSSQSSAVLKNLIRLLLRREGEAMIGTAASNSTMVDTATAPRPLPDIGSRSALSERASHTQPESVINILVHGPDQGHGSNPSFAQRLNESLASVQQIIPPFQNEYMEPSFASESRGEGAFLGGQSQHVGYAAGSYQGHTESPGQHAVDYGANGLFWLWDSTWSGQVP
ncbi:Transcriptional activator protein acu-15 [Colletotrichum tropicale]|nr:Transcriptional activator protein acu-15 [Colletotrichum tropicale]